MEVLIELCGWIGAILVLGAYFLISTNRVTSDSISFQLLNVIGALTLIIYTYSRDAFASVLVNSIWVLIGLKALLPYFLKFIGRSAIKAKDAAVDVVIDSKEVLQDGIIEVVEVVQDVVQEVVQDVAPEVVIDPVLQNIPEKRD